MWITRVSINNPVFATMVMIAILVLGVASYNRLAVEQMPDIDFPVAVVFVSFLWELGYRVWGPLLTIPFALVQGVIFLRTRSLGYVVTVHLLFDAVVFAVLVHAHNPGLLDGIFLVSP